MSSWSSGIVVASMSMPATRVDVSFAASVVGAAAPETPSKRANRVARTTNRRTGLLIARDLHEVGWGGAPTRASVGLNVNGTPPVKGSTAAPARSSHGPLRAALDNDRLVGARPVRHRRADRRQRLESERPELEVRPHGNGDARARIDVHDLGAIVLPAPHLAASADEVPDLFDGPVPARLAHLPGAELEVGHATGCSEKEDTNVGAVRGDLGRDGRQSRGLEVRHLILPAGLWKVPHCTRTKVLGQ